MGRKVEGMARHEYARIPDADARAEHSQDVELHGEGDSGDEGDDVLIMNAAGPAAPPPPLQLGAQGTDIELGSARRIVNGSSSLNQQTVTNGAVTNATSANANTTPTIIDTTALSQTPATPRGYDYPPPGSPPPSASRPFHFSTSSISTPRILSAFAIPNSFGNSNGIIPTGVRRSRRLNAATFSGPFCRPDPIRAPHPPTGKDISDATK